MIKLIEKSKYKKSLWKNGKGETAQISIFPLNSTISANDFDWRISIAQITQSNYFSQFPSYERQLVIWKGGGLLVNQQLILPKNLFIFSGEEEILCDLIDGLPVIDFGIIYKKESIKAKLEFLTISKDTTLEFNEGTHFLFLSDGTNCSMNGNIHQVGDTLAIEKKETINIQLKTQTSLTFFHVSFFEILNNGENL